MKNRLLAVALSIAALQLAGVAHSAEVCSPADDQWYSGEGPLVTRAPEVLLVTHASTEFNGGATTIAGIQKTILALQGRAETIYLHRGSFDDYVYPSCKPDYFYHSQGGEIDLDLEATRTVVMVGGYYSYCLGDTHISVVSALERLKKPRDIRLVYVLDGIFEAMNGLQAVGGIDSDRASYWMSRVGVSFNYADLARALAEWGSTPLELIGFLSSAYPKKAFPENYRVVGHLMDRYSWGQSPPTNQWITWNIQDGSAENPAIDLYYVESADLALALGP